jgi:hypothetical protein
LSNTREIRCNREFHKKQVDTKTLMLDAEMWSALIPRAWCCIGWMWNGILPHFENTKQKGKVLSNAKSVTAERCWREKWLPFHPHNVSCGTQSKWVYCTTMYIKRNDTSFFLYYYNRHFDLNISAGNLLSSVISCYDVIVFVIIR